MQGRPDHPAAAAFAVEVFIAMTRFIGRTVERGALAQSPFGDVNRFRQRTAVMTSMLRRACRWHRPLDPSVARPIGHLASISQQCPGRYS